MSDHWKALADLLGTPPLDRGSFEAVPEKTAEKPSEKAVASPATGGNTWGQAEKVVAGKLDADKSGVDKSSVDKPISEKEVREKPTLEKNSSANTSRDFGIETTAEKVLAKPSEDRQSFTQQEAAEKVKSVEEKSAVSPAVPKRSAGWDALARLFGLSAPPPDADVPLPESPKETGASRSADPRPVSAAVPPAPPAVKTPTSVAAKPLAEDELTDLGWGGSRGSRERAGRDVNPREGASKDIASREASARESSGRESSASRDVGPRSPRDSGPRDSGPRDSGPRDSGSRETHDRGRRHDREGGVRETSSRDVSSRDRDNESRESGRRERESTPSRERNSWDPASWEAPSRGEQVSEPNEPTTASTPRSESSREEGNRHNRRGREGRRDNRQQDSRQQDSRQQSERPQGERGSGRRDQRGAEGRESEGRGGDRRGGRSEGRFAESKRGDDLSKYDHRFVENDDSDIEDLDEVSFTPPRGKERPRGGEEAWASEVETGFDEVADEGGQPERRGRRRRGRRRGGKGQGETLENRGARPESTPDRSKREGFGRASDEDGDRGFADPVGSDLDVSETPTAEDAPSERRGRRRRRRGGRRQEPVTGSVEDLDSSELDLSEGYNLPGLLADEIESSDEEERGHTKIPTWEESVGVLVRLNIDARHRPDGGKGGQRHGGQHGGHGGNGGQGRGRGGNRPPNKR